MAEELKTNNMPEFKKNPNPIMKKQAFGEAKSPMAKKIQNTGKTPYRMNGHALPGINQKSAIRFGTGEEITETWEDPTVDIVETPTDITTTTSQIGERRIISPGDIVEKIAKPGTPEYDRWLAAKTKAEKEGKPFGKRYESKIKKEPLSKQDIDIKKKPTKKSKQRYESIRSYKDYGGGTKGGMKKPIVVNIGGKKTRMDKKEYDAFIKKEGYTKDPNKPGSLRRRSTTGKGKLYDPSMVDISEKPGFTY